MRIKDLPDTDIEAACALFFNVFALDVSPSAWRWKYHGSALLGSINLVAYGLTGEMIGHAGAVVLPGIDQGGARPMVQICDVMVAAHRRGGAGDTAVYPALMRAMCEAINQRFPGAYAYGFPGKRPFLLGERLGFYRRAYDIQAQTIELVAKPHIVWPPSAVRALDWGLLTRDPARFERIWTNEATSAGSPAVKRDTRYLLWRYAQHPSRSYKLLMLRRPWRDVAWWVVSSEGATLRVVDALGHEARSVVALKLLGNWAAQQGFTRLLCWHLAQGEIENATDTGIVAMQFVLGAAAIDPLRKPQFMPGDLDVF